MRILLSTLGRYAPVGVLAGIQLAVIAMAPSVAPSNLAEAPAAIGSSADAGTGAGGAGGAGGAASGGAAGAVTGPVTGGAVAGGAAAAGGPAAAHAAAAGPVAASGDTSHCVGGREFDVALAWFAPPCVAGTPGGTDIANGGATYRSGVTGNTIEIVDYITNYGAEINAILAAQHQLVTAEEATKYDAAVQNFLNKKFVLWGRKIHIDTVAGQCNYQDDNCMIPELEGVIKNYHPYMMLWFTTVCPECFSYIASRGVIAVGGLGFSGDFAKANAPFYYSATGSSTLIEEAFAEWWCSSMSSANSSRVVTYTGDQNVSQKMNGRKRVLGFISPNKPDNENTIQNYLWPRLKQLCGEDPSTFHHYWYAQDINTAAQQVQAGNAQMDTPTNPATSVVCICDVVAPEFTYQGEQNNNYWPENIIADVQGMGQDPSAQPYDAAFSCPNGNASNPCSFDDAVGVTVADPPEDQNNDPGIRIWHEGGGTGPLPGDSQGDQLSGILASSLSAQWVMMATLIENAGPRLEPYSMQKAALQIPPISGGNHPVLQFSADDWHWTRSVRVVWWDAHRKSSYNNQNGTWVSWPSPTTWFTMRSFPDEPGGPPGIPPARQRTS
ncbi:MAG TPA: hypothetical protein VGQ42_15530 [Candidatus Dormibacteraeota bacterium]|jgi:hypothetical protein|nr:hypothetical protein [Candidatus Dormibacteraeota bacterium]